MVKVAENQLCQNAPQPTIWSYHAIRRVIRLIVPTHVTIRVAARNVMYKVYQLLVNFFIGPSFIAAVIKPKSNDEVIISRVALFKNIFLSQKKSKKWPARWTRSNAQLDYYVQLFPCLSFSGRRTTSWRCMHRAMDSNQSRHGPGPSATGCVISTQRWIQLVMLLVIRFICFYLWVETNRTKQFETFKRTFKNILTGQIFRSRK